MLSLSEALFQSQWAADSLSVCNPAIFGLMLPDIHAVWYTEFKFGEKRGLVSGQYVGSGDIMSWGI